MRKQLNEQLARIKTMMGINEIEKVDLTTYDDNNPLITDIERIDKTNDDGTATVSMTLNSFLFDEGSKTKGTSFKIKVVVKFKISNKQVKELVSIKSEIPLDIKFKEYIKSMFINVFPLNTYGLINILFEQYKNYKKSIGLKYSGKKLNGDLRKLVNTLNRVIDGDEIEKDIPTKEVGPEETPKNDRKDIWTSTSTWDVK